MHVTGKDAPVKTRFLAGRQGSEDVTAIERLAWNILRKHEQTNQWNNTDQSIFNGNRNRQNLMRLTWELQKSYFRRIRKRLTGLSACFRDTQSLHSLQVGI
jgi:hypothetical protein